MTEQYDDRLGPDAERVRTVLRGLPPEPASPAFRARLRNDFVSGRIAGAAGGAAAGSRFNLPARSAWVALPLAALLAVAVLLLNRGPDWDVAALAGTGWVTVDGERMPVADGEAVAERLRPGARLATGDDARVNLLLPGRLVVEITPGSEVTLPTAPGRWWGRTMRARVDWGEMLFATGEDFPGHRFLVQTPEARVEVTGTAVSVFRAGMGTCVCVETGTARIGTGPRDLEPVPAGRRKVVPVEGAPFVDDIAPPHRDHIRAFLDRMGDELARP